MENKNNFLPISAEDARDKTEKFLADKNAKQLKEIFQKIRKRIVEGEYYLDLNELISPINKSILEKYGYKITYPYHSSIVPMDFYVRIDWSGFEFKNEYRR